MMQQWKRELRKKLTQRECVNVPQGRDPEQTLKDANAWLRGIYRFQAETFMVCITLTPTFKRVYKLCYGGSLHNVIVQYSEDV